MRCPFKKQLPSRRGNGRKRTVGDAGPYEKARKREEKDRRGRRSLREGGENGGTKALQHELAGALFAQNPAKHA